MSDQTSPDSAVVAHLDAIAASLRGTGQIVIPDFIPVDTCQILLARAEGLADHFRAAGIGRGAAHQANQRVRSDDICWLDPADPVDRFWLASMETLRMALNRRLFLGLFEYEAHYARYAPGDFYRRHRDAFRGEGNRILTTVLYLNPRWSPADGGELVIHDVENAAGHCLRVVPQRGTLVIFLSEEFPHEVLPALRTRYSIAGWFRLNANRGDRLDPPR